MISGIGTDIIEISRLENSITKFGQAFLDRVYTPNEQICVKENKRKELFFAGRWAAKEAVSKALGCGIGKNCSFLDIEILPNSHGKPMLELKNQALSFLLSNGGGKIHVSISHENSYAIATAIWEK